MPDTIEPGKVYNVWIDIENRSFDVVGGVQNGGDRYSVHIAEEGAPSRTTLFTDFTADRDGVTIDPALALRGDQSDLYRSSLLFRRRAGCEPGFV